MDGVKAIAIRAVVANKASTETGDSTNEGQVVGQADSAHQLLESAVDSVDVGKGGDRGSTSDPTAANADSGLSAACVDKGPRRPLHTPCCGGCGSRLCERGQVGCNDCGANPLQHGAFCPRCSEEMRRRRGLQLRPGDFAWCRTVAGAAPWPAVLVGVVFESAEELQPLVVRFFHSDETVRIGEAQAVPWCGGLSQAHGGTRLAMAIAMAQAAGAPPCAVPPSVSIRAPKRSAEGSVCSSSTAGSSPRTKQRRCRAPFPKVSRPKYDKEQRSEQAPERFRNDNGHGRAASQHDRTLAAALAQMEQLLAQATANEQRLMDMLMQFRSQWPT